MIPVWIFLVLVALWVAFRLVTWVVDVFEERTLGFQLLVMLGSLAYGVPPLLRGNLFVMPFVLLGAYIASSLFDLRRPIRWFGQRWAARRHEPAPDNVVPLRSS